MEEGSQARLCRSAVLYDPTAMLAGKKRTQLHGRRVMGRESRAHFEDVTLIPSGRWEPEKQLTEKHSDSDLGKLADKILQA